MPATPKTATVMFTDLVGSTALSHHLGRAAADDLIERHFAALRDGLAIHRGIEVKTLGDGMMAVFESVSDGLACAVTMQRSVVRANRLAPERPLSMRVAVGAGETKYDRGDYFGPPVVEASRLCAEAGGGEIYVSNVARILAGGGRHRLKPVGTLHLRGFAEPVPTWSLDWDPEEEFTLRVALADDSVLLRQGVASVLTAAGFDVVQQASDATTILDGIAEVRPNVVVLDVRMPPTYTTEGLRAAEQIRAEYPDIAVLLLSASIDGGAARRLLASATDGVGYLLKDRVADVEELTTAIRTVASGGSVIDPEVLASLAPYLERR